MGRKGYEFGVGSNSINPAFNDSINNPEMLLILGNYFEIKDTSQKVIKVSTKTGGRFCYPLIKDKIILNKLNLQDVPLLPIYTPESNSKPDTIAQGFSKKLRQQLTLWNCPTSQGYSFRHLGKMLGKLSGLNPSIIADNMGHSLSASEQFYNRKTLNTAKDLAKTDGYPLPLNIAKQQLEINGIDTEDSIVQAVLRIVYQMR
jgi:hypothetical protein